MGQLSLIPYTVIERSERASVKVTYDVRVDLVDGRLPNESELAAVSRHLHAQERPHERTFVSFYLPGMQPGAGAFATAHHDPVLKVQVLDYMLPDQYRHLLAPRQDAPTVVGGPAPSADASVPTDVRLDLRARTISAHEVEFTVTTNIPLPIEVMADVNLKGQKPDDVWIGYQERVRIESSPQVVVLDTSKSRKPLPVGEYEAEVFFNYRYAKNPKAASIKGNHEARADVGRLGAGESAETADERNRLQRWVMENVITGTAWNEREFVERLGAFEKFKPDLNLHEAYYFPKADMTLLVNTLKGEATVWRMGRASR